MSQTCELPVQPSRYEIEIGTADAIHILHVTSAVEDCNALRRLFRPLGWSLRSADTIREAVRQMHAVRVPVVVCDRNLPDGDWLLLRQEALQLAVPPRIVVSSRFADERLWSVVLNLGGFDLLSIPFDNREVRHVITHAWTSWHREAGSRPHRKTTNSWTVAQGADPLSRRAD